MTNYDILLSELRELGMDFKWAKMFVKKLAKENGRRFFESKGLFKYDGADFYNAYLKCQK